MTLSEARADPVAGTSVVGGLLARGLWLVTPFFAALLAGGIVLLVTGRDPLATYALLAEQGFGGRIAIGNTLAQATPVLFAGLATAVAFRSGIFNVGVEGGIYIGAFAAAWVAFTFVGAPGAVLITGAFAAAAACGALWSLIPGFLRARWRVDEVVTTLMLNFVAINFTSYLVNGPFLASGIANSMSPLVDPAARLSSLVAPTQVSAGIVIALLIAGAFGLFFRSTTLGYELRVAGTSPRFALASGISIFRVILVAMIISGFIAGIAGATQVLGVHGRFIDRFSPGYGFTGIAVALLGRNTAIGCILAALLFGGLSNGSAMMQLFSDIPLDLVNVLTGVVMIFAVLNVADLRPRRPAVR